MSETDSSDRPNFRDAEARLRSVTTFDRPLVVEAGAGTGKTATLVARILVWITGRGWELAAERERARGTSAPSLEDAIASRAFRGVTAITFTEAAAAEMAARVGEGLAKLQAAAGSTGGKSLLPGIEPDMLPEPDELSRRCRALRSALDQFDVGTFHAFCRRILVAHPFEAGLAPNFDLDATGRRTEEVLREEMEAFLSEAPGAEMEAHLFALARAGKGPADLEGAVLSLHKQGARASDLAADPLRDEVVGALLARLRGFVEEYCEHVAEPFSRLAASSTARKLGDPMAELHACFLSFDAEDRKLSIRERFEKLQSRARDLIDSGCKTKLGKWAKGEFGKKELEELETCPEEQRPRIHRMLRELGATLPPLTKLDLELLEHGRRAVSHLLARLEAALHRRGLAGFADLLVETRALLGRSPDLARRIRSRIDQLLVDEFQDTDEIQCDIVRSLALAGGDGTRPALFVVGDPKQSIYTWRGADLTAYEAFRKDVVEAGGEVLELSRNFRSVPSILAEVDRCIAPVMEETRGVQPSFVGLEPHREEGGTAAPAIEHWITWLRDPETGVITPGAGLVQQQYEAEARAVAADLRRRIDAGTLEPSDAALLFRSTGDMDVYLAELRARSIPYEVRGDRTYYRRREVLDANVLVRAVLDPADRIALAGFLRAPFVGMPDAALVRFLGGDAAAKLRTAVGASPELLEALRSELHLLRRSLPTGIPGLQELGDWTASVFIALRHLLEARREFASLPIDRWVDHLRERFLVDVTAAARFLGRYRISNLDRFFRELVESFVELDGDTQAVLRRLRADARGSERDDRAGAPESRTNAVQVATIHGSKGLQYGHVYLVQTHKKKGGGGRANPAAWMRMGPCAGYEVFGAPTPNYAELKRHAAEAADAERVRLLYVALTRAADRLVILGAPPKAPSDWRRANSTGALLTLRANRPQSELEELAASGAGEPYIDAHGVHWRLTLDVADDGSVPESRMRRSRAPGLDASELRADGERLERLRCEAEARASRPWQARPSEGEHLDGSTGRAGASRDRAEDGTNGLIARTVGTLVHRLIEEDAPELDVEGSELADRLEAHLLAAYPGADAPLLAAMTDRARRVLARMRSNGLRERLTRVGASVVARELPVVGPPPATGGPRDAVSFTAGAVDLLIREGDELVVVDFKTDEVETAEDVERRAAAHASQGTTYTELIATALDLAHPPAFELWFLSAPTSELAVRRIPAGSTR